MKQKILVILAGIFLVGFYASAKQPEKGLFFLAVDFKGEFFFEKLYSFPIIGLDLSLGGHLAPQHTLEFVMGESRYGRSDAISHIGGAALRYSYDFIEDGKWIPGVSVSALLGSSVGDAPGGVLPLRWGIDFGGFLKKSIAINTDLLLLASCGI